MRNATVFLSVFSFCDFFSLNKYSISLPSVLFHSCLGSPIPSLPLPYLQSSFPWPQERFLWEPGKVVYRSWNSPGCWGWGHALPRHQKLCLWVRLLWLLCSQFKAYCPKMLPDRSDRVLWWLLGQDALTHEAAEDPTKAKCQRANADTGIGQRSPQCESLELYQLSMLDFESACFTCWEWGGSGRPWWTIVCPGLWSVGGALRCVQSNKNIQTSVYEMTVSLRKQLLFVREMATIT